VTPSSVSRSINSSGASVTRAALVPSAYVIGTRTGVVRTPRIVSAGLVWSKDALILRFRGASTLAQRMQGKNVGDRTIERCGYAQAFTQFNNRSREPAHFKLISALKIVMH